MRPQSIKTNRKKHNMHQHFVLWSSIITTILSFLTTPPPEWLNADNSYQNEFFLISITHEQILSLINRLRDTLSTIQHPSPQIHNLMNLLYVTCTMIPPHPPLSPHYVQRNMKKELGCREGQRSSNKENKTQQHRRFCKMDRWRFIFVYENDASRISWSIFSHQKRYSKTPHLQFIGGREETTDWQQKM